MKINQQNLLLLTVWGQLNTGQDGYCPF